MKLYISNPITGSLLNGYVMTLQKFEKLLNQEVANGNVNITESLIETDNIFEL